MNQISKSQGGRLKKMLAVTCLLCMLLSLWTITASAQVNTKITVSSCTVERGDTASVTFNLEDNPGIWGVKLRINYDNSALTLKTVKNGNVFDSGEFTMSESLSKKPYVVMATGSALTNKTKDGTIVTLEFEVNSSAKFQSYPVTAEIVQVINVDGDKVDVGAVNGNVSVVECKHENKEWRVTVNAGCETAGTETLTCKKCETTFETRTIKATGHQHTEIRDAIEATSTTDGYTGDTYCKDCNKLISKGEVINKLENNTPAPATAAPATAAPATAAPATAAPATAAPATAAPATAAPATAAPATAAPATAAPATAAPATAVPATAAPTPAITVGTDLKFIRDSKEPLVFISNADFSKFIRVEIDGEELDDDEYSAESGSTIITVSIDCLNKLSNGKHTLSIVSEGGTASTQFTVQNKSVDILDPTGDESSVLPIIIVVILNICLISGTAVLIVNRKRRTL